MPDAAGIQREVEKLVFGYALPLNRENTRHLILFPSGRMLVIAVEESRTPETLSSNQNFYSTFFNPNNGENRRINSPNPLNPGWLENDFVNNLKEIYNSKIQADNTHPGKEQDFVSAFQSAVDHSQAIREERRGLLEEGQTNIIDLVKRMTDSADGSEASPPSVPPPAPSAS